MKHLYELAHIDLQSTSVREVYNVARKATQAEREVVQEDLLKRFRELENRNYKILERTNGNHST